MGSRSAARTDASGTQLRLRTTVGGAIVLLLVAGAAAVLSFVLNAPGGVQPVGGADSEETATAAGPASGAPADAPVLVHVLGAVAEPGLYQLAAGERIVDAVAAAGGFSEEADQAALNLARVVSDGEQVYVPVVGEAPPVQADAPGGLLNLNTADAAELETLPGLGPELAGRIVEWRTQNGPFSSVDDLLNVTGIGAKTLSGLADLVTT